jgi:ABC-type multidrug transport system fused ATPase/permease subunit
MAALPAASHHADGHGDGSDGSDGSDAVLTVADSDFCWGSDNAQQPPQLRRVSFAVRPGELVVVAGPVGAGKSTLIEAVLGEVGCVRGGGVRVKAGSRLAYCAQQPWIQAGTVRDNVLFARAEGFLDPDRYDHAVAMCALTHDLERLEQGDMTQIGELGINLSGRCGFCFLLLDSVPSHTHPHTAIPIRTHTTGGQRARVALARAVYADADLYLLDDVLSAVDAEVSKHLFHQVIVRETDGGLFIDFSRSPLRTH